MDGLPEQPPGSVAPSVGLHNAGSNYVVTDLGNGRFAFYVHLQPGSRRVRVGDMVTRGQVLRQQRRAPPALHVMNGPDPLASNGLPFVFRLFDSEGTVTSSVDDFFEGRPATIGSTPAGRHQNQVPLDNEVVSLPTLGAAGFGAAMANGTERP